jgi:Tol biopolymer transport system component
MQVWVRPLDAFAARALPGTEDAVFIFWSPDGQNLGFFAQGKLKRIAVSGGPAQTLCDAESSRGGSWGHQDVIIFAKLASEIYRIPASGGLPQRVTTLDASRHEATHRWPFFLPDGNRFLFMASPLGPANPENVYYLGSLDGKGSRVLFHGGSPIVYAMGHVLYLDEKVLMARPFELSKLDFTGEAFPIAESVQSDPVFSNALFSASQNGLLLYQEGKSYSPYSLLMFDREGKQLSRIGEPAPYFTPRFSPDGKRLVYTEVDPHGGKSDIWVRDIASGYQTRVTSDPRPLNPIWSPDGAYNAYSVMRTGIPAIFIKPARTVGVEQELWRPKNGSVSASDWTPDGKYLVLSERLFSAGKLRIALLLVTDNRAPEPIIEVPGANVDSGLVSPDGKWIAYRSDESGKNEVYISSFPKPLGKLQVSSDGGSTPRWKRDGKELYYLTPDNKLVAAQINYAGSSVQVVATRVLFQTSATLTLTGGTQYDVTPDGSRFLVVSLSSDETHTPLNLVVNWTAELKKK